MGSIKRFNNLLYSIICLVGILGGYAFFAVLMYSLSVSVSQPDPKFAAIVLSAVLLPPLTIMAVLTFIYCFDYYIITPNEIIYRRLFQRKRIIRKQNVCSIEKKTIFAMIPSVYRTEAYVISDKKKKKIPIFIDEKTETEIRNILEQWGYTEKLDIYNIG